MIPRAEIAWLELELQAFSSDREYRDGLGQARFDGAVRAYERLGLLSAEEAARWRERFADKQKRGQRSRRWRARDSCISMWLSGKRG